MINILIKNKVLDWCISAFFDKIGTNFNTVNRIEVGNRFSHIKMERKDIRGRTSTHNYTDCIITHVYTAEYFGERVTIFNFTTKSGDIILACDAESIEFKN